MRFTRGADGVEPQEFGRPLPVVRSRKGPISKLSPILSAILVQGIAERATGDHVGADKLGRDLAALLLGRHVLLPEFRKWKKRTEIAIPDPTRERSEPERSRPLRDWLVFRFERFYCNTRGDRSWPARLLEAENNPKFAFTCVGDQDVASVLYGLKWG
jgi:hypothetical protein